ncbi:MAG: hypothetical protein H6Q23_823 [Bacteroidetes bacterium]|nr:hypothetical protein [Bacteroidota bacterium]
MALRPWFDNNIPERLVIHDHGLKAVVTDLVEIRALALILFYNYQA